MKLGLLLWHRPTSQTKNSKMIAEIQISVVKERKGWQWEHGCQTEGQEKLIIEKYLDGRYVSGTEVRVSV